jgi:hypothetical protein
VVRSDSVNQGRAKGWFALLLGGMVLLGAPKPSAAAEELVLIVAADSNIDQLDSPLVRRLFLGLTVTKGGARLRPMLNESDPRISALFLQNIVSMSESTYDRYLLRLSLLQGRTHPTVYRYEKELIDAVASDPTAVGYVWARDVAHEPRVKILRVLWHD